MLFECSPLAVSCPLHPWPISALRGPFSKGSRDRFDPEIHYHSFDLHINYVVYFCLPVEIAGTPNIPGICSRPLVDQHFGVLRSSSVAKLSSCHWTRSTKTRKTMGLEPKESRGISTNTEIVKFRSISEIESRRHLIIITPIILIAYQNQTLDFDCLSDRR